MLTSPLRWRPFGSCSSLCILAVLAFGPAAHASQASSCTPGWAPALGQVPGVGRQTHLPFEEVSALVEYDDGAGPALFVGGTFNRIAGQDGQALARWDGTRWSTLAGGTPGNGVLALGVYDDGSGPALYAGGKFSGAGGVSTSKIARWDGASWSALGTGVNDWVWALAVHDDGGGSALYVGGEFGNAGGVPSSGVARWAGSSWSSVGGGTNLAVRALSVFDDGTGAALHAAGRFTSAGGVAANRVARWDGTSWWPLGAGLDGEVWALTVHDDGTGPALYAGGDFAAAGGAPAAGVARWDGTSWSALGSGTSGGSVRALASFDDDGNGADLYAGGLFTSAGGSAATRLARWDGAAWSEPDGGVGHMPDNTGELLSALALTACDLGGGERLYVGGDFTAVGDAPALYVAAWRAGWSPLGTGFTDRVRAAIEWDDGSGPALYFCGHFDGAGGVLAAKIVRWDGQTATPLGSGLARSGFFDPVANALAVYDDGTGPGLYVTGIFTSAGGVSVGNVARWDGTSWSAVPNFSISQGHALAVYDNGGGPALYIGGESAVYGWDGVSVTGTGGAFSGTTFGLVVYDDGGGAALYGAGTYGITSWGGSSLQQFVSGVTQYALAVHDDGTGPALYTRLGCYDGTFSTPPGYFNGLLGVPAYALASFDDGAGPQLYMAGQFSAGGVPVYLARWNGSSWSSVDGLEGWGPFAPEPGALSPITGPIGTGLYVGGILTGPDGTDGYMPRWGCAPDAYPAFCDASDGALAACPCGNAGAPDTGCDLPQATGGVRLDVLAQSTSPNGATLRGSGFNPAGNTAAVAIRSTSLDPASPVVFGDGLRCVNGSPLVRLGAASALGGVSTHVFGHGAMAGAGTFYYQLWFRSNPSTYCDPGAAFNLSSGRALTW